VTTAAASKRSAVLMRTPSPLSVMSGSGLLQTEAWVEKLLHHVGSG
jgi:hypothetical protein